MCQASPRQSPRHYRRLSCLVLLSCLSLSCASSEQFEPQDSYFQLHPANASGGAPSPPVESSEARFCTQIGCIPPLTVRLAKVGGWSPGRYRVVTKLDDRAVECAVEFPVARDARPFCDAESVMLGVLTYMVPPEGQSLYAVTVLGPAPESVSIEVFMDGQSVATGSWRPTYGSSYPNGGCGPRCDHAPDEILAVPAAP